MKISELAKAINNHCQEYQYFYAYGTIRETFHLWIDKQNRELLCNEAQIMYSQLAG